MRARVALGVALILCVLTYGSIFHYFLWYNHVSDMRYLETDKCPACYGRSLCQRLEYGMGKFTGYSRLQFINSLANIKNVNFGKYAGEKVVYKKLAHDNELQEFDEKICAKANKGSNCNVVDALHAVVKSGSRNIGADELKGLSDLTRCPSQRLVDKIVHMYKEKADAIDMSFPEKLSLITTLSINQEPIILQVIIVQRNLPSALF